MPRSPPRPSHKSTSPKVEEDRLLKHLTESTGKLDEILADVGKPSDPRPRGSAEKMARDWGGRVLDEKTTFDGIEAFRIRVEKRGEGLRPVEGIVATKAGKLYLLMGGVTPFRSVVAQLEEVRKAWRWVD